ncbi:MAG: amidohydrolase, partial [Clostridia bacterium]|nr:amidohydrolase [Clostridia bacterium]
MKNIELAKQYEDYIIGLRRHFHEHPELTGKEFQTLLKVSSELEAMGIPYVEIPEGGILATLTGHTDNGKAVLLRADLDALAIWEPEENLNQKRVCKSQTPGVMHACGHDGHIAMLLGAAKLLQEQKDTFKGTVYLCFERGEEGGGNVRYILEYLEREQVHIDSVYAAHLYAEMESGKIAINDGAMMACNMAFHVTIRGKGGHGSRPDLSNNPIDAFVDIYNR